MIDRLVGKAAAQPIQFAIGAGIVVAVAYFVIKRAGVEAAKSAVGIVSGDNALTHGTPYENKGVVGTVAAAANRASGGYLQSIGESLGGWVYDVTHRDYDPSTGLQSAQKTVNDGARATDLLWGRVGSVQLRAF
jgi:hypothetical protein